MRGSAITTGTPVDRLSVAVNMVPQVFDLGSGAGGAPGAVPTSSPNH